VHRFFFHPFALFMIATVCFSIMAASVKAVSSTIPVAELIFVRSLISACIIAGIMYCRGSSFHANYPPLLVLRAVSGLIAMGCKFYVLGVLGLGDSSVLTATYPLWAIFLSMLLLGERPAHSLFLWVLLAWIGIAAILRPQLAFLNFAGSIALLGALFIALNAVIIRKSQAHDSTLLIAFYFSVGGCLVTGPMLLHTFVWPSLQESLFLVVVGVLGGIAQVALTEAYGRGDVSRLAPLSYFGVIFSYGIGFLFWNEVPTTWTVAGTLLVIGSCVQIMRTRGPAPVINR
jgi:drug/metabolite transporter (DMT)-like permease